MLAQPPAQPTVVASNFVALARPSAPARCLRSMLAPLLLLGLAACWDETKVDAVRIVPGTFRLPGVTHIILGEFRGPGGVQVAHEVAGALMQRRSFAVTDLSAGRPFGVPAAFELAPAHDRRIELGTDAGITATVVQHGVDDDWRAEERLDADGALYTEYVRHGTLHLQVAFRAVDPHAGTLLDAYTAGVHWDLGEQLAAARGPALEDADAIRSLFAPRELSGLFFAAYGEVALQFVEAAQMHQEPATVTLYHAKYDGDSTRAIEAVRRGDWPLALAVYRSVAARLDAAEGAGVAVRAMAHYNVGVAYTHIGALSRGLYELEWSQAIDDTPLARAALAQGRAWEWEARQPR